MIVCKDRNGECCIINIFGTYVQFFGGCVIFSQVCNAAERLPDVSHVVFVVHGVSSSIIIINVIILIIVSNHHNDDQVGGVMDEGTIGRNASAMRENVSHILTKVIRVIITINQGRNFRTP